MTKPTNTESDEVCANCNQLNSAHKTSCFQKGRGCWYFDADHIQRFCDHFTPKPKVETVVGISEEETERAVKLLRESLVILSDGKLDTNKFVSWHLEQMAKVNKKWDSTHRRKIIEYDLTGEPLYLCHGCIKLERDQLRADNLRLQKELEIEKVQNEVMREALIHSIARIALTETEGK